MNLKRLYQKSLFLPVVIAFTYLCLLLDTIKYPGFIGNHFYIDAKVFLTLCLMAMLLMKVDIKILKIINIFNLTILVFSGLSCVFFSIQEALHYANYVLSEFHFSLAGLIYVFLFSVSLLVVDSCRSKINLKLKSKDLWKGILCFFIIYALIVNLGSTFKVNLVEDVYIGLHLSDTYDQKMKNQWGDYYDYMIFVRENTPEDATIIVPPQVLPWVRIGNAFLDRYFLYPRKLIQYGSEQIPDISSLAKGTYVMITWGDWECDYGKCKIWPQQKINAQAKIIKNSETSLVKEIKNNIIFTPEDTIDPYGLLKI